MSTEQPDYTVHVFGKEGCAKCSMLNRRLDTMLSTAPWKGRFAKKYQDLGTEEGLVAFCLAQCLNPSRIPAMLISRKDESGRDQYLDNPEPGTPDPVCKQARLYQYLGLQTDYGPEGRGLLTPEMLETILTQVPATSKS